MHRNCGIIWNWKGKDNGSSRRAKPCPKRKNTMRHPGGQATAQSWVPPAWRKTSLPTPFLSRVPTLRRPEAGSWGKEEEQTPCGEKVGKPRSYFLLATLSPQGHSSMKSGMRGSFLFLWGGVLKWVRVKWWCHHTMTEVRQFLWQSDWRNFIYLKVSDAQDPFKEG